MSKHSTVYAVAFDHEGRFMMVYNNKRRGWEMPGGRMEPGETPAEAAAREFAEEAGYSINVWSVIDHTDCYICPAYLGKRLPGTCEMKSRMFSMIPEDLSFPREEYEIVIPLARSALVNKKTV